MILLFPNVPAPNFTNCIYYTTYIVSGWLSGWLGLLNLQCRFGLALTLANFGLPYKVTIAFIILAFVIMFWAGPILVWAKCALGNLHFSIGLAVFA